MLSLPNLLTAMRIVMTPVVAWAIAVSDWRLAGALFVVAAVSDALDGWLARKLNATSSLGEQLDPIADKALINAAMTGCALAGLLPVWLAGLTMARDAMILLGALLTRSFRLGQSLRPLRIGKVSTAGQMTLIALALGSAAGITIPAPAMTALIAATALVTLASGGAYLRHWLIHHPARKASE